MIRKDMSSINGISKSLVLGIGNPSRGDDGLGSELVSLLEKRGPGAVTTERVCQLNVEDALTISRHELVIFADASVKASPAFSFEELAPIKETSFTSHSLTPGFLLHLCEELYGRRPQAYLLSIGGEVWDVGRDLSQQARKNLGKAISFLQEFLNENSRRSPS
jgi:hydrogenase maturation protease